MPIYDYRCLDCGKISEVFLHRVDNPQPITCHVCGGERMEKLISPSYLLQREAREPGQTCCGKSERCEMPPCSTGDICSRR